jgi:hypothetical protein
MRSKPLGETPKVGPLIDKIYRKMLRFSHGNIERYYLN